MSVIKDLPALLGVVVEEVSIDCAMWLHYNINRISVVSICI